MPGLVNVDLCGSAPAKFVPDLTGGGLVELDVLVHRSWQDVSMVVVVQEVLFSPSSFWIF